MFLGPLILRTRLMRRWCSVALIVQIHLQQNRSDLALKEVQAAKRWAQDSLLVNLAESWVGLRVVCGSPLLKTP
jgi:coatomer protein complex subunit epsilon